MAGRPTKLTPDVQRRIVAALKTGNYFETACEVAGISSTTGYEWLARGEGKDPKGRRQTALYAQFAEKVRLAEAKAEVEIIDIIRTAIPENPRLGLEFIARRHPNRWSQRDTLTLLQKLAGQVEDMTDAELIAYVTRRNSRESARAAGDSEGTRDGSADADAGTSGE